MKVTGALFNKEMILRLLDGSKTQSRRPNNLDFYNKDPGRYRAASKREWINESRFNNAPNGAIFRDLESNDLSSVPSPWGGLGDLVYAREATEEYDEIDNVVLSIYSADKKHVLYSGSQDPEYNGSWAHWWYSKPSCPSIHCPRWASRLTLEIISVKTHRINSISTDDIRAEGIIQRFPKVNDEFTPDILRGQFIELWNSIYKNWTGNPWVWAYEFKVHHKNVDEFFKERKA